MLQKGNNRKKEEKKEAKVHIPTNHRKRRTKVGFRTRAKHKRNKKWWRKIVVEREQQEQREGQSTNTNKPQKEKNKKRNKNKSKT